MPLIILVVFLRMVPGRHAPTVAPAHPPRRHGHWKWLILVPVIGISLFSGLMVAAVGGALYPPLTRIAAPLACDGDFSIQTSQYSYKPGQRGSTYQTLCSDRETGEAKDVTTRAFLWSSLVFSGVAFVPLLALALFLLSLLRKAFPSLARADAMHPHAGTGETLMDRYRKLKDTAIDQRPHPRSIAALKNTAAPKTACANCCACATAD